MALLADLFPGIEAPPDQGGPLVHALEEALTSAGLQVVPEFVAKMVQVFDCKVGCEGSGGAWACLAALWMEGRFARRHWR